MKKLKLRYRLLISFFFIIILSTIGELFILVFISFVKNIMKKFDMKLAFSNIKIVETFSSLGKYSGIIYAILFGSILLYWIYTSIKNGKWKKSKSQKYIQQAKTNEMGDARFIIDERDDNIPKAKLKEFEKINQLDFTEPSWITRAKLIKTKKTKNERLEVNGISVKEAVHNVIIGATGSGKSQKYIIPTIIHNSRLEQEKKPCMVITDPKGEVYEATAGELEKQGYEVLKINLRNPMESAKFNPLASAWDFYMKGISFFEENIIEINKDEIINDKIKCYSHNIEACGICLEDKMINDKIWYTRQSKCFFNSDEKMEDYTLSMKKSFFNLSSQEVNDLVETLYDSGSESQNKSFFEGAKGLVKGVMLLLLELKEKFPNLLKKEQYNMPTIVTLIANQDALVRWFTKDRENNWGKLYPTSPAWVALSGVINSSENNRANLFSQAAKGLSMFEDISLRDMLCQNDLDLFGFVKKERPSALFLIVPDDRTTKHALATTLISQLYKALTYTASTNLKIKGKDELDRDVLFILDEFGNLPTIPNFATMITVSRGRRIFFALVLQAFQQLKAKYQNDDETILSNCLLTTYLKTTSDSTLANLSKRLGKTTILTQSLTGNAEKDKDGVKRMETKDLMTPSDIQSLPIDYQLIIYSKSQPSVVSLVPSWQTKEVLNLYDDYKVNNDIRPLDFEKDHFFNLLEFNLKEQIKLKKEEDILANPNDIDDIDDDDRNLDTPEWIDKLNSNDRKMKEMRRNKMRNRSFRNDDLSERYNSDSFSNIGFLEEELESIETELNDFKINKTLSSEKLHASDKTKLTDLITKKKSIRNQMKEAKYQNDDIKSHHKFENKSNDNEITKNRKEKKKYEPTRPTQYTRERFRKEVSTNGTRIPTYLQKQRFTSERFKSHWTSRQPTRPTQYTRERFTRNHSTNEQEWNN